MIRIRNLSLRPEDGEEQLWKLAEQALRAPVSSLVIVRRSVDARKKSDVRLIVTADVAVADEDGVLALVSDVNITPSPVYRYDLPIPSHIPEGRPVIVGFGPAGMFSALVLAQAGLRPIVLERGEPGERRAEKVRHLKESGILDPESNIQFGRAARARFRTAS